MSLLFQQSLSIPIPILKNNLIKYQYADQVKFKKSKHIKWFNTFKF